MIISAEKTIIIIAICAVCTFAERFFPFAVFGKRNIPPLITYLGKALPMAVMSTLVIYCIRNTNFTSMHGFLPQFISVAVTAALHFWKGNTLLSVVVGTACYMMLVQLVF